VGERLLSLTGMLGLVDPAVLTLGTQRWVLSHGDAYCLGDTDYQLFRSQVRANGWQADFLARPLSERLSVARQIRQASEDRKGTQTVWADVDADAATALLAKHRAQVLVHGHTHQAAVHPLGEQTSEPAHRCVLSDWDANGHPPRLEVLRWQADDGPMPHLPRRMNISDLGISPQP